VSLEESLVLYISDACNLADCLGLKQDLGTRDLRFPCFCRGSSGFWGADLRRDWRESSSTHTHISLQTFLRDLHSFMKRKAVCKLIVANAGGILTVVQVLTATSAAGIIQVLKLTDLNIDLQ